MGNCCGAPATGGTSVELGDLKYSGARRGGRGNVDDDDDSLDEDSLGNGSDLSRDSMDGIGGDDSGRYDQFHAHTAPPDFTNIKEAIAQRGSLSYGTVKKPCLASGSHSADLRKYDDKMPLQTLNFKHGRGKLLFSADEDEGDMELGEDPSQLKFGKVLQTWQEDKKVRKRATKNGFMFKFGSSKKKKKEERKKEKLMMWETFLKSKNVTQNNPAWRHAKQTYTSSKFQEKAEYLFASLDTNGVGFLEKHEFMFMVDGLRGRMHHFLRNTRALYFTQKQDEVLPSDQEFVLSEDFKTSLVGAIQQQLFTWRMTPHAWAVDKDLFENLVSLIFCSTVYLIMTDEGKSPIDVPVAIEFYLLMSSEGIDIPCDHALIKSASRSSDTGDIDHIATSLFCKTIFDLHMICPPQSSAVVDETVLECSREEEDYESEKL